MSRLAISTHSFSRLSKRFEAFSQLPLNQSREQLARLLGYKTVNEFLSCNKGTVKDEIFQSILPERIQKNSLWTHFAARYLMPIHAGNCPVGDNGSVYYPPLLWNLLNMSQVFLAVGATGSGKNTVIVDIVKIIMEIQRKKSGAGGKDHTGSDIKGAIPLEKINDLPDVFTNREMRIMNDNYQFKNPSIEMSPQPLMIESMACHGYAVEASLICRGNTTSNLSSARRLYIQTHRITDEGIKRSLLEKGVESPAGKPHFMISCCFAPAGLDLSDVKDMRAWAAEGRCDTLFSPAAKSGVLLSDVGY